MGTKNLDCQYIVCLLENNAKSEQSQQWPANHPEYSEKGLENNFKSICDSQAFKIAKWPVLTNHRGLGLSQLSPHFLQASQADRRGAGFPLWSHHRRLDRVWWAQAPAPRPPSDHS